MVPAQVDFIWLGSDPEKDLTKTKLSFRIGKKITPKEITPLKVDNTHVSNESPALTQDEIQSFGNQAPHYPKKAIQEGWEGDVSLIVYTDEFGHVSNAHLIQSSTYDILDKSALDDALHWKLPFHSSKKSIVISYQIE